MKTSNKILVGVLVFALAFLTAVHLVIYARYKAGRYVTSRHLREERFDSYPATGNLLLVSLAGLDNVTLVPSDTPRVEIEKGASGRPHLQFGDGVLSLRGDTLVSSPAGGMQRIKSYRQVVVYLPSGVPVQADFCGLTLMGSADSLHAPGNHSVKLNETDFHIGWVNRDLPGGNYFDSLQVDPATRSSVDIYSGATLRSLTINLSAANLDDNQARIGRIYLQADTSSTIKLSGANLANTRFILK
ncbi:MAG TPA: hypothetical protein VG870_02915 [Chitinophagaceae bacterium]|nr:hypothetical protein [Chitinophagaceae bacterium]